MQSMWNAESAGLVAGGKLALARVPELPPAPCEPDAIRGRVSAVNSVFIGASNELGEFRAGTMASVFGAVPAVVIGGIGTLAVAIIWATGFPQLRKIDKLDAPDRGEAAQPA